MKIVTLLTDFGTDDEYVGVMKGGILSLHPEAAIVDITHSISPQDVVQAAFSLEAAYPYFPAGTVHLVVVDPGVGAERSIIALKARDQIFVAPDNGVLSPIIKSEMPSTLVRVENAAYFLDTVSQTFHGRDIIAPVAVIGSRGYLEVAVTMGNARQYFTVEKGASIRVGC